MATSPPKKQKTEKGKNKDKEGDTLPSIQVTEEEEHIFDTLMDVVKTSGCGTVMRAAGGWVRDKVNNKEIIKK